MTKAVTVYVPCDAAAVSVGADDVALAIEAESKLRDVEVKIIRNGSSGMLWLEPLVEVVTDSGHMAYGPVAPQNVRILFDLGSVRGKETLDEIITGEDTADNLVLLDDICELMTDGSLCAMGGLTPMPVRSAIEHFPKDFEDR